MSATPNTIPAPQGVICGTDYEREGRKPVSVKVNLPVLSKTGRRFGVGLFWGRQA